MARAQASKKKDPANLTQGTSTKAIRKADPTMPRASTSKVDAAKRITDAFKSGKSDTAEAKGSDVKAFEHTNNSHASDKDDDDSRGECWPDDDMGDVNYQSSDGASSSGSDTCHTDLDSQDDRLDEKECAFDCDYGNLEEAEGSHKVLMKVSIENHERVCCCELDSQTSSCRRVATASVDEADDEST